MTKTEEQRLRKALERISKRGDKMATLRSERRGTVLFFQLLQDLESHCSGHLCLFHQYSEKAGQDFGRSLAMRVDDVGEVVGLFEKFFELGAG